MRGLKQFEQTSTVVVVWYTMHAQTYIADEVSLGLNAYMTIVGGILGILSAGMYKLIGVGT